eukprot:TRINITY_DN19400_c0_g1_i9.p1 TRINITY_DN19400_c0_g1~~TRINITY_DN19400_c0_g1_i9.p1  ORF type:complete len:244 (+),score=67.50 TRINITY_DN19400_c0_g1_i9:161-892(+)
MLRSLVGSEMCIRDRVSTQSTGDRVAAMAKPVLWERDEDARRTTNGEHPPSAGSLGNNTRGAVMPTGFHHIALVCKNMGQTIKFYEGALGMKLRAVYPMHGIKGAKHCFLEAGNGNEISFVEFTDPKPSTNPPSFFTVWPEGSHHHMAYRCETLEQLHKLRSQVKAYGVPITKVVDHDFIHSCYFTDPSGFNLEITCTLRGYTEEEFQPDVIFRSIQPGENDHAASDKHGNNVTEDPKAKAKL